MKLFILRFWLILILLCNSLVNHCQDMASDRAWYVPHFVPVQYAGNLGLISTGIGYNVLKNKCKSGLVYGYVPESVSSVRIHLVSLKNTFSFPKLSLDRKKTTFPYAGLAAILEVGGKSFLTQPSYFPKGYYAQNALHFSVFGGIKHQKLFFDQSRVIKGIEFYAETGAMDFYLYYTLTQREIRPHQVFSLALGVNIMLASR